MSLKEKITEAAQRPVDYAVLQQRQEEINEAIRTFMAGDLSHEELQQYLKLVEKDFAFPEVRLDHAGPLYGALRKYINFTKEESDPLAEEERAHFFAAREIGMKPYFQFLFSEEKGIDDDSVYRFHVFVKYSLSQALSPEETKDAIYRISTAPPVPSSDDLAKLPEGYSPCV